MKDVVTFSKKRLHPNYNKLRASIFGMLLFGTELGWSKKTITIVYQDSPSITLEGNSARVTYP